MGTLTLLLLGSVLLGNVLPALSDVHSLQYIYTALSKPLDLPGIYEFIALGMLDDRELDYYNSEKQVKVPMQSWMKEKMQEDYWDKGTQSRKSKEQWFKVNVGILMDRMRHNKTDLHVLQWRHGCVINEGADGQVTYLKGIDEYSYDGSEFLSFDEENLRWIAPVRAAEETKRKWDNVAILNQYTKSYLEKECVNWLTKFMEYGKEELRKHSSPDVHIFMRKSITNPDKMTLTCMATGFYPKDVDVSVRKSRTSLPEHMLTSSGVRPNGDGTYQLRKSVDIDEKDKHLFDCYVNHSTMEKPVIKGGGEDIRCQECSPVGPGLIGGVIGIVASLAVVGGVCIVLVKRGVIRMGSKNSLNSSFARSMSSLHSHLNFNPGDVQQQKKQCPIEATQIIPRPEPNNPGPQSDNASNTSKQAGSVSGSDSDHDSDDSPTGSQTAVDEATPMMQSQGPQGDNASNTSKQAGSVSGSDSGHGSDDSPTGSQTAVDEVTPMMQSQGGVETV